MAKKNNSYPTPKKRFEIGKYFIMDKMRNKFAENSNHVKGKGATGVFHENRRQLDERAFYPPHSSRTESPEYKKAHDKLVRHLDLPCLVCGVKYSTLKTPKENPFKARQLETHHHIIEWALANAIDVEKFNRTILPSLRKRHPEKHDYQKDFTAKQVVDWVDHSEDNLWVLCDVHHRHKWLGIHEVSFPIWGPQDLYTPEFEKQVSAALGKDTGNPGGKKTGASKQKK